MISKYLKSILRTNKIARHARDLLTSRNAFFDNGPRKIASLLNRCNNYLVVDVGANVGQFGIDLRRYGYKGEILSIEPIAYLFEKLDAIAKRNKPWSTSKLALGSTEGVVNINISGNDGLSSSILKTSNVHVKEFPSSVSVNVEETKVVRLKNLLIEKGIEPERVFLKIDVQGFELEVLKGCEDYLKSFLGVFCEVSLSQLYENAPKYWEVLQFLDINNQQIIDMYPGIRSSDKILLQIDVLTFNRSSI